MFKKHLESAAETKRFAAQLAKRLVKRKLGQKALILALSGDLGSGKTTFVQGFLRGLGVRKKITSPTFVLIKNYKLQTRNYKLAYHIDCYRVKKPGELVRLGAREVFNSSQNIVLIEWAEKIRRILPKGAIWLRFEHGKRMNERLIQPPDLKQRQ